MVKIEDQNNKVGKTITNMDEAFAALLHNQNKILENQKLLFDTIQAFCGVLKSMMEIFDKPLFESGKDI